MNSISTMPANAKVWVYQSNRFFSDAEVNEIKELGYKFVLQWAAHGASLKASFDVFHHLFVVMAVDEQQAMASGCSIDSSVKFIKELEVKFNLSLFDRMQVAYKLNDQLHICTLAEFEKLAEQKMVNEETIVYNNMVTTKTSFDKEWEGPLKNSWQKRVLIS